MCDGWKPSEVLILPKFANTDIRRQACSLHEPRLAFNMTRGIILQEACVDSCAWVSSICTCIAHMRNIVAVCQILSIIAMLCDVEQRTGPPHARYNLKQIVGA